MKTILANILPGSDLFDGEKLIPLSSKSFRANVVKSLKQWVEKVNKIKTKSPISYVM